MREYEINKLDNGLRIITCHMPGMESASVGVWVGVGGRFEDEKVHGISHFVEHLLFKGTKKRSGPQISRAIEGVGGHINAYTSEEYTCYMIKVRGKHQKLALDVLWDMVTNPLFNPKDIEKERHVVKEEIHMILDSPAHYVGEVVHQLMWSDHPLGRMLIGTEKSIDSIQHDDIIRFQRSNYFPMNMLISAAGNIDVKRMVEDTKRYTKGFTNYKSPKSEIFKPKQTSPQIKVISKPTEQIHVCIGMYGVPREDPDRYTIKLLSTILGENMSSRLFQVIRERHGLSYDINSGVSYFRDTGGFVISSGVKLGKLEKFLELVFQELGKIKKNSITDSELKRAKEFYEGQLALEFEKTMTKMLWMGESLLSTGKVPTVKEVLRNVEKVKAGDIQRLSNRIFNSNILNVAIIGPVKEDIKLELGL